MENPYLSIIVTYITYQMNLGVEMGKKLLLAVQIKSPTDTYTKGNQNLHVANYFAGFLYFKTLLHTSKQRRLACIAKALFRAALFQFA